MYYGSGTAGRCCICDGQTLHAHSPDGSTFLREMTSWPTSRKWGVKSKIRLRQSMQIHEKQSCEISPQSDLKRLSLRLFEGGLPNKNNKNKMRSDVRSDQFLIQEINFASDDYTWELASWIMVCRQSASYEIILKNHGRSQRGLRGLGPQGLVKNRFNCLNEATNVHMKS